MEQSAAAPTKKLHRRPSFPRMYAIRHLQLSRIRFLARGFDLMVHAWAKLPAAAHDMSALTPRDFAHAISRPSRTAWAKAHNSPCQ
jgi:hypothetical protein